MRRQASIAVALSFVFLLSACSSVSGPRVTRFDASASTVPAGSDVTLSWSVSASGPVTVTIDHGVGAVSAQGSIAVTPTQSTSYTLTATGATGSTTATVRVSVTGTVTDTYNIALDFVSSISSTQQAAFEAAGARWDKVVTVGLPDTYASLSAGACGSVPNNSSVGLPTTAINQTIDDVRIDVWVGSIDGTGGILGQGGPCMIRSSDGLTLYGVMEFDAADLAYLEQNNLLQSTILHEMGHVLGIGTLWNSAGRALLTGAGTTNPRFVGLNAVREWHALGGNNGVPVENCLDASGNRIAGCGAGTEDGHWREAVFGNELMTGYLNPGSDPLSRMTIGSLQDLGYAVDYSQADAYALPAGASTQSLPSAQQARFLLITPKATAP